MFPRFLAFSAIGIAALGSLFNQQLSKLASNLTSDYRRVLRNPIQPSHSAGSAPLWLERLLRFLVSILGVGVVAIALTAPDSYFQLVAEDGIIESASAILWFSGALAALVSILIAMRRWNENKVRIGLLLALFGFMIVCGGEEISWGQRLLHFDPPEALKSINKQEEMTLHNIGSISIFSNAFFLVAVGFLIGIPFIERKYPDISKYLRHYNISTLGGSAARILLVGLLIWLVIGIRFGTLGFHPFSLWGYYTQMDDEIFEFLAAYAFMAFAVLNIPWKISGDG